MNNNVTNENEIINNLLQEEKKLINIPTSLLQEINNIRKKQKLEQYRTITEVIVAGINDIKAKYGVA